MPVEAPQLDLTTTRLLGWHETFRRLGFEPDDIYVVIHRKDLMVQSELRAQGLTFTVDCGERAMDAAAFRDHWLRIAAWWNEASNEEAQKVWNTFQLDAPPPAVIVERMTQKGFKFMPFIGIEEPFVNA